MLVLLEFQGLAGFYQDDDGTFTGQGALNCKKCPESTTTVLQGTKDAADCVCMAGTIDVADGSGLVSDCVACTKGLDCPAGSTLASLRWGTIQGPRILPGFMAPNAWCASFGGLVVLSLKSVHTVDVHVL